MDTEAWRAVIHGVPKSRTWLSDWTELKWTISSPTYSVPDYETSHSCVIVGCLVT